VKPRNLLELYARLSRYGVTPEELLTLLRIERTLGRWALLQCNGDAYIDDDGAARDCHGRAIRNPEPGALRRAAAIAKAHRLTIYHQGDPRGCSLYLLRRGDVPKGKSADSCYTNGVAVWA
jgi:hypothetical protein